MLAQESVALAFSTPPIIETPAMKREEVLEILLRHQAMDFAAFRADPRTVAAAEPKAALISEAAARLGGQAETLCPGQPWRNIRGLGNWLRHQYDRIDIEAIWRTIEKDLPSLKASVTQALSRPPQT